jgi:hypothetical protein
MTSSHPEREPLRPNAAAQRARDDDAQSLDLVQRVVISTLLLVVLGAPTAALAIYSPMLAQTDRSAGTGLWIMCGVIGLTVVAAIRVANRRFPLSAYLLLGLAPAAVSAFYIF